MFFAGKNVDHLQSAVEFLGEFIDFFLEDDIAQTLVAEKKVGIAFRFLEKCFLQIGENGRNSASCSESDVGFLI